MAKTKPIGVRFDELLLEDLKNRENITGHQQVLNFLSNFYLSTKLNDFRKKITPSKEDIESGKVSVTNLTNPPPKSNYTIDTRVENNWERESALKRITELRAEIKNPPKNPIIGIKKYILLRESEIQSLEAQFPNT